MFKLSANLIPGQLEELEQVKSDLEVSILQEEIQKPKLTREQITFWICRFRETDVTMQDQRQRLIDSFVNSIYLYEDKMFLSFNYKDGQKTITFSDIKGSDLITRGAPKPDNSNPPRLIKNGDGIGFVLYLD